MEISSTPKAAGFNDLPNEILLDVSKHFDADAMKSARLVCRRLQQATFDKFAETYVKRLHFSTSQARRIDDTIQILCKSEALACKVKQISLESAADNERQGSTWSMFSIRKSHSKQIRMRDLLSVVPSLETLHFDGLGFDCKKQAVSTSDIRKGLQYSGARLERLTLYHCTLSTSAFTDLIGKNALKLMLFECHSHEWIEILKCIAKANLKSLALHAPWREGSLHGQRKRVNKGLRTRSGIEHYVLGESIYMMGQQAVKAATKRLLSYHLSKREMDELELEELSLDELDLSETTTENQGVVEEDHLD